MTEHTPGPWVWENDHVLRSLVEPEPQDSRVLSASRTIRGEAADLSLIAAAPALLAAAEAAMNWIECSHPDNGDVHCMLCKAWTDPSDKAPGHLDGCPALALRAAISQARGEA